MSHPLQIGVLLCGSWAVAALCVQVFRARAFGRVEYFSAPAGDPRKGVAYLFGAGMSPTAKESAREHLPIYFIGVGYHAGIVASLGYLALLLSGAAPGGLPLLVIRLMCAVGAVCGVILFVRRLADPLLRELSCPDDAVANLLTTVFTALALARAFAPWWEAFFMGEAMVLFLYVPLGKIKHCFFFFTTRYYLGMHFGRRGALPPAA